MPTVPAYPVDAVDTDANGTADAPLVTGKMARQAHSLLMVGSTAARPLGARTGVRHGTPKTTVTATGTTWTVKPHVGVIDLEASSVAGPYTYVVSADLTGSVTAASGSGARVDIIYAQINDSGEADGTPTTTASHVKIDYAAGTGGSSTPPVTPARAFVLAYIDVPVSGGGSPVVRWVAPISSAAGGVVPVRTDAEMTALAAYGSEEGPVYADRLDRPGSLWRSTGGAWIPLATRIVHGSTALVGSVPSGAVPYMYAVGATIPVAADGTTDVTWPTFPNAVIAVFPAMAWPGTEAGATKIKFTSVTLSGCAVVFTNDNSEIVAGTGGNYVVSLLVVGA